MTRDGVIGREQELATISGFLDRLTEGPATLVLTGEPGVGKTTLWQAGLDAAVARSSRVLTASPAETEVGMSFAGLGDLLADTFDEIRRELPPPQRHALEVALLLVEADGDPPDPHAVAVGFLAALRALSVSTPLLVAIDDVQWLDSESATLVNFAGRRLREERVGLFVAERTVDAAAPRLELDDERAGRPFVSIRVGPFTLGALHRLLHMRCGLVLPRPVLRRVHETAGGNPFYAIEIARALERDGLRFDPGLPLPVPRSLSQLLRARIAVLPQQTQEGLLVAAALSQPRGAGLAAALDADPRHVLAPAVAADLIVIEDDRIRFTHPLLASAVYESADANERRRIHSRIAEVVEDVEEKARHLALAAPEADAGVAATLESAATHARSRGATAAAADLCEHAARLTPPELDADRRRRAIAAARYSFVAGDTARARALLEDTLPTTPSGEDRAQGLVVRGLLHRYEGDQQEAARLLRQALAETEASDRVRADAAQGLASTLFFMRDGLEEALEQATLACKLAARADSPALRAEAMAMKGLVGAVLGRTGAIASLQRAGELDDDRLVDRVDSSASWAHAYVKLWTDEPEAAAVLMRRHHDEAIVRGNESSIANILTSLALAEYLAGRWRDAARIAERAHETALQAAQQHYEAFSLSVLALVKASLGLEDDARSDADRAMALAGGHAMAVARTHGVWALGLLGLSLGRPDDMLRTVAPERERLLAAGVGEPGAVRFVPDEIEALVELGRLDEAEVILGWLEERGRALHRDSAVAAGGRCRGLLAAARGEIDLALAAVERALATHERVPIPFDRARTLLALGSVQRRARKRSAARETLTAAISSFEELGAVLWAQKARAEVARVSGRVPGGWELSETERRVAELVAGGLTNREAAARLSVTQKTVEFHLRNVFRKLGVRSRTELARSQILKD